MTILQTRRLQLHNKQLAVVTTNMRRMQMTDLLPERDGICVGQCVRERRGQTFMGRRIDELELRIRYLKAYLKLTSDLYFQ